MGGVVSDVVGGATDIVKGGVDVAGDMLKPALAVGKWSTENPLEAAALAAGGYYAAPYLMGEGAAAAGGGGSMFGGLFGSGAPELLGEASGAWATNPAAAGAGSLGLGSMGWGTALGAGALAAKALGGSNTPSSSTSSTSIDPQMKAAYLRNLEEARTTAAGLGQRQFAAFPEYSTNMVQTYMNPYQQEVIDASMGDIERQRQQQQLRDRAAAVQAKAFGGSRQGVAEALTNEAFSRTAANTAAQLRSQGFTQAQQIALQQEEARRQYEQQKLDAARNLGLERLGVSQAALGLQPANLGGTKSEPIYTNTGASVLGGALTGAKLGGMIGTGNAGYGALAGGLLGLLG